MSECRIIIGDSRETLKTLPDESVNLVVTSPPYDDLRHYGQGKSLPFDFDAIAAELMRTLLPGGVICWVAANKVVAWGESLTAERQRIRFSDLGFAVRKMIYHKLNFAAPNETFYHRLHEDITLCCKGSKPRAWNPIKDIPTVWKKALGRNTIRQKDGTMKDQKQREQEYERQAEQRRIDQDRQWAKWQKSQSVKKAFWAEVDRRLCAAQEESLNDEADRRAEGKL